MNIITTGQQSQGHAMAQAASALPAAMKAQVQSKATPGGICSGQRATVTSFPPSTSAFPI